MHNYHTHTFRCHHASGDVSDYVAAAKIAGLSGLGISDHVPFPDKLWAESRMDVAEIPEYAEAINKARQFEVNADSGFRVWGGFEAEWRSEMDAYLRDLLGMSGLEYLVGGIHFVKIDGDWLSTTYITQPRELRAYADHAIATIRSGLFAFIAHPDVFCVRWHKWNDDTVACSRAVIEAAVGEGVPLEINGYGLRKPYVSSADGYRPQYPFIKFWELAAKYGAKVMVNSDAHRPIDVGASLTETREIANRCGLLVVEDLGL